MCQNKHYEPTALANCNQLIIAIHSNWQLFFTKHNGSNHHSMWLRMTFGHGSDWHLWFSEKKILKKLILISISKFKISFMIPKFKNFGNFQMFIGIYHLFWNI